MKRAIVLLALCLLGANKVALASDGPVVTPQTCPPSMPDCHGPACQPGDTQSCTLSNGCSGVKTCTFQGGAHWGTCTLDTNSQRSCSSCGTGSIQACHTDGTFGACTLSNVACGSGVCAGTHSCSDGTWSSCSTSGTQKSCSTCTNGKFVCDTTGHAGPCTATYACGGPANCSVQGTQTCTEGTTTACSGCGGQGHCATCASSSNPGSGTGTCSSACVVTGTCTGPEVCNQCDDNHDSAGLSDEGLYCAPCKL